MTDYAEQGERAIVLSNPGHGVPYAETGETAVLLPNPGDPLVPGLLEKYELRTAVEGYMEAAPKISSDRHAWDLLRGTRLAQHSESLVVLTLDAKNHPINIVQLPTDYEVGSDRPTVETFQNILAVALLSGGVAFILCVRASEPAPRFGARYRPLNEMAQVVGLSVLDIVVFSQAEHVSMRGQGGLEG